MGKPKVVSSSGQLVKNRSVTTWVGSVIVKNDDGTYQTLTGEFYKSQFQWGAHWGERRDRSWQ